MRKRTLTNLWHAGAWTVRDVYAFGLDRVSEVRNIGSKSVATLQEDLGNFLPEMPLVDVMESQDVARFCSSLDQVPLAAVDWSFLFLVHHRVSIGEALSRNQADIPAFAQVDPAIFREDWMS